MTAELTTEEPTTSNEFNEDAAVITTNIGVFMRIETHGKTYVARLWINLSTSRCTLRILHPDTFVGFVEHTFPFDHRGNPVIFSVRRTKRIAKTLHKASTKWQPYPDNPKQPGFSITPSEHT